jgi:hypothetical protein
VFPAFGVPEGLFRGMVILLALGFPAALLLITVPSCNELKAS